MANPTSANFLRINNKETKFYSTRDARLFPWMTLALRGHWEIENKHMRRLFNKPNLTGAEGEKLADILLTSGSMERKQNEKEKNRLFGLREWSGRVKIGEFVLKDSAQPVYLPSFLGWTLFRRGRQGMEDARRAGWDSKFFLFVFLLAGFGAGAWEMAKQMPRQFSEGVSGGGR